MSVFNHYKNNIVEYLFNNHIDDINIANHIVNFIDFVPLHPKRLVMVSSQCDFCNTLDTDKAITYMLEYLEGWIICDSIKCSKMLRLSIINFYCNNQIVPLDFYKKQDVTSLSFYRKSINSVVSSINNIKHRFVTNYNFEIINHSIIGLSIHLQFDTDNGIMGRFVSLSNIFFHNKDFYNILTTATNINDSDKYGFDYSDLSDDIKTKIKMCYDDTIMCSPEHKFDN